MTLVCETWLARDFLRRAGRPLDIPPCECSTADCPPIKETEMNEEIRDQAAQALFNEVYRMFLDGTFAESKADRDVASQKFLDYLRGASKDELVSVLCTAFDELVVAQMPDDEQDQGDTTPTAS